MENEFDGEEEFLVTVEHLFSTSNLACLVGVQTETDEYLTRLIVQLPSGQGFVIRVSEA